MKAQSQPELCVIPFPSSTNTTTCSRKTVETAVPQLHLAGDGHGSDEAAGGDGRLRRQVGEGVAALQQSGSDQGQDSRPGSLASIAGQLFILAFSALNTLHQCVLYQPSFALTT